MGDILDSVYSRMVVGEESGVEESIGDTGFDGRGFGRTEGLSGGTEGVAGELALRRWCRVGLGTGHFPWVLCMYKAYIDNL